MGFWSGFKKWAPLVAGAAAVPFTGGTSLLTTLGIGAKTAAAIGAGAGIAGKIAGGASNQRAQDRGAQAEYDVSRVPIQNQQALQFADAKRKAEADRMRQIGGADMLANFKPSSDPRAAKFQNNGQLSGGQMNPETIAMIRARAMQALESGSDVPQMQTMPDKPGGGGTKTDSFLNALTMAGTGLGALRESGVLGGGQQQPPTEQGGAINLPNIPGVGAVPEDERPWWMKQAPITMRGN